MGEVSSGSCVRGATPQAASMTRARLTRMRANRLLSLLSPRQSAETGFSSSPVTSARFSWPSRFARGAFSAAFSHTDLTRPSLPSRGEQPSRSGSPVSEGVDVDEMKPCGALCNHQGCAPLLSHSDTVLSASLVTTLAVALAARRGRARVSHRTGRHIADCNDHSAAMAMRTMGREPPRLDDVRARRCRAEIGIRSNVNATGIRLSLAGPGARRTPGWWFRRRPGNS